MTFVDPCSHHLISTDLNTPLGEHLNPLGKMLAALLSIAACCRACCACVTLSSCCPAEVHGGVYCKASRLMSSTSAAVLMQLQFKIRGTVEADD